MHIQELLNLFFIAAITLNVLGAVAFWLYVELVVKKLDPSLQESFWKGYKSVFPFPWKKIDALQTKVTLWLKNKSKRP